MDGWMAPRTFTGGNGKMARQGRIHGESGEDSGGSTMGVLKRKRTSPPESPAPSKKVAVSESGPPSSAVSGTGEALEVYSGQAQTLQGEPRVTKQLVGKPHASVAVVVAGEQSVRAGIIEKDGDPSKIEALATIENLSHGQGIAFQAHRSVEPSGVAGTAATESPSPLLPAHIVPCHAGWFSWTKIHRLERQGLPEFFTGKSKSRTPEIFMQQRNTIISKYRENPGTLLKLEDVQDDVPGELSAARRVFEFLDHWGLINYQAGMDAQRIATVPQSSFTLVEDVSKGELQAPLNTKPALANLFHFETLRAQAPAPKLLSAPTVTASNMSVSSLAEAIVSESLTAPHVDYHCNSCGTDCSKRRYHCQKQADFDLCPDCYSNGMFGEGMASTDFIRMDALTETADLNGGGWTDQETLLLLEALELYNDNWNEIAEHVATKSKAQCILHFIRLPIEDPFLEEMEVLTAGVAAQPPPSSEPASDPIPVVQQEAETDGNNPTLAHTVTESKEDAPAKPDKASSPTQKAETAALTSPQVIEKDPSVSLQTTEMPATTSAVQTDKSSVVTKPAEGTKVGESGVSKTIISAAESAEGCAGADGLIAFADAGNPVMSQVAFLAAMVGPRVAAAAAQSALQALSEEDPIAVLLARNAFILEPPEVKDDGRASDRLPVPNLVASVSTSNLGHSSDPPQSSEDKGMPSPKSEVQKVDIIKLESESAKAGKEVEITQKLDDNGSNSSTIAPDDDAPSIAKVRSAAATALASAAVKAKILADQEEREIQRLVVIVIENQLKKLEMKLKNFQELETMLGKECEQVERARQKVYSERARLMASRLGSTANPNQTPQSASSATVGKLAASQGPPTSVAQSKPVVFTFGPTGASAQVSAVKGNQTTVPHVSLPTPAVTGQQC